MYVLKCDASGEQCQMLTRGGSAAKQRLSVREFGFEMPDMSDMVKMALNTASGKGSCSLAMLEKEARKDMREMNDDLYEAALRGQNKDEDDPNKVLKGGEPGFKFDRFAGGETADKSDKLQENLACALYDVGYFKSSEDDSETPPQRWSDFMAKIYEAHDDARSNAEADMKMVDATFDKAEENSGGDAWDAYERQAFLQNVMLLRNEQLAEAQQAEPAAPTGGEQPAAAEQASAPPAAEGAAAAPPAGNAPQ